MEAPFVTVLLPFYNAHATLHRAIESIVTQTFQDWQLLLVDNNADSISKQISTHWHQRDSRVKIIHEPIQGIANALNTGLKHVRSKYVARMDADDVSHSGRLQKQFDFLEEHNDIGVVACACAFESNAANAEGYRKFVRWQNAIITPEQHFINRFIESPVAHPSVMFRNDLVETYGNYSTENLPEDYELWLRWMENGVKFYKLKDELLTWHDDEKRLSRTHENYLSTVFDETKMKYLARWLKQLDASKQIVVCGTGKSGRSRAALLEKNKVNVFAFTDVKQRGVPSNKFIPVDRIGENKNLFYVNFISKRDVRNEVRKLFISRNLVEGENFILAA